MSDIDVTQAGGGADAQGRGTRTLVLATLQQAGLTMVRFGMPALVPFVREDLALSFVQVGVLLAAMDIGGFPAFIPTGVLADRWGERRVLRAGGMLVGSAAILGALVPSYGVLLFCLAVAGVGFPSGHTAGIKAVVRRAPAYMRGFAIGVRQAGLPIGGMAAALMIPALAGAGGWRVALVGVGVLCLLFGLFCGWLPLDPPLEERQRGSLEIIPGLLRNRDFVSITLLGAFLVVGQFTLAGYLPLFFIDRHGWSPVAAAHLLVWIHLGAIAGRLGWGAVSDRFLGGKRRPVLGWVIPAGAVIVVGVSQFPQDGGVVLASTLALMGGISLAGWNGLIINLFTEWVGIELAATALGAHLSVLFFSSMVSPPLFGWVVDMAGSYTPAWLMIIFFQGGAFLLLRRVREGAKYGGDASAGGR